MNPIDNRPSVINENRVTPTIPAPANSRPLVDGLEWAFANYKLAIVLKDFSEAVFERDIMTNDEAELITIIAKVQLVDYSPFACSNAFLTAHQELVERMTELAIARSVFANARRRGESAAYVNHSAAVYRQRQQPFRNAQNRFWALQRQEDERIEREMQSR